MLKLKTIPKYGDHGTGDVRLLQLTLNDLGLYKGSPDDWFGDKTLKALQAFQKSKGLPGSGIIPADGGMTFKLLNLEFSPLKETEIPVIDIPSKYDNFFGAPWIGANIDLLGKLETDPELNKRYVPEWKLEGLPGYGTLSGNKYAWCSVRANADRRKVGVDGTDSAGAASWSKHGRSCPFWFGAALPIKHKSGGRHIADFLYWINEKKKICATLDGNRSNRFDVNITDLSGKGDTLVGGPRWSKKHPDGMIVTMEQVLYKYPFLKVKGSSSSGGTR